MKTILKDTKAAEGGRGKLKPGMLGREEAVRRISARIAPLLEMGPQYGFHAYMPTLEEVAHKIYGQLKGQDGRVGSADLEQRMMELEEKCIRDAGKWLCDEAGKLPKRYVLHDAEGFSLDERLMRVMLPFAESPRAQKLISPYFEEACREYEAGILGRIRGIRDGDFVNEGIENFGKTYGVEQLENSILCELRTLDEIMGKYADALEEIGLKTGISRDIAGFLSEAKELKPDAAKVIWDKAEEVARRLFGEELGKLEELEKITEPLLEKESRLSGEMRKYWPNKQPPQPRKHAEELARLFGECESEIPRIEERVMGFVKTTAVSLVSAFDRIPPSIRARLERLGDRVSSIKGSNIKNGDLLRLHKLNFPEFFEGL